MIDNYRTLTTLIIHRLRVLWVRCCLVSSIAAGLQNASHFVCTSPANSSILAQRPHPCLIDAEADLLYPPTHLVVAAFQSTGPAIIGCLASAAQLKAGKSLSRQVWCQVDRTTRAAENWRYFIRASQGDGQVLDWRASDSFEYIYLNRSAKVICEYHSKKSQTHLAPRTITFLGAH